MAFEPDIIVTGPELFDVTLVVEANASLRDVAEAERQLKKYMAGVGSPLGMLVTPNKLWLYRDQYLPNSEQSIRSIGAFDLGDALNFDAGGASRNREADFEDAVQSWIESLTTETGLRALSPELRQAIVFHVSPVISQGVIRAGHPRPASALS